MEKVKYPEMLGVSSQQIAAYLDELEKSGLEQHSLILLRHGRIAYEASWKPATLDEPHMLFSLSKSFTSAAAAFAVSEGLISYEDKIVGYFQGHLPKEPSEWLGEITIKHLLTMTSGLAEESDSQDDEEPDWPRHVLGYPVKYKPGTHFHYNSFSTYLVSHIVQQVTGQPIVEYLKPRLWDKLGIRTPFWPACPKGVNVGGWGLRLSAHDIAKFGQLMLRDGMLEGKRVLPDFFVKQATAKIADNSNGKPDPNNEWAQGYGMQFWRCVGGYYRGDGMGGQLMIVIEKLDAVIVVTAASSDMGLQQQLIREYLVPALLPEGETVKPDSASDTLIARTAELTLPTLSGDDGSVTLVPAIYKTQDGIGLLVDRREKHLVLGMYGEKYSMPTFFAFGEPSPYYPPFFSPCFPWDPASIYQASYEIKNGKVLALIRACQCPFLLRLEMTFEGDTLTVDMKGVGVDNKTMVFQKQA